MPKTVEDVRDMLLGFVDDADDIEGSARKDNPDEVEQTMASYGPDPNDPAVFTLTLATGERFRVRVEAK